MKKKKLNEEKTPAQPTMWARKCDATDEGMNEGYCFGDGEMYFKYEQDALKYAKTIGYKSLQEAYDDEAYYHTAWEDEFQYKEQDGKLVDMMEGAQFVLLGEIAKTYRNESFEEVMNEARDNDDFKVVCIVKDDGLDTIISETQGWFDFALITETEFDQLNELNN